MSDTIVGRKMSDYPSIEGLSEEQKSAYLDSAEIVAIGSTGLGSSTENYRVPLAEIGSKLPDTAGHTSGEVLTIGSSDDVVWAAPPSGSKLKLKSEGGLYFDRNEELGIFTGDLRHSSPFFVDYYNTLQVNGSGGGDGRSLGWINGNDVGGWSYHYSVNGYRPSNDEIVDGALALNVNDFSLISIDLSQITDPSLEYIDITIAEGNEDVPYSTTEDAFSDKYTNQRSYLDTIVQVLNGAGHSYKYRVYYYERFEKVPLPCIDFNGDKTFSCDTKIHALGKSYSLVAIGPNGEETSGTSGSYRPGTGINIDNDEISVRIADHSPITIGKAGHVGYGELDLYLGSGGDVYGLKNFNGRLGINLAQDGGLEFDNSGALRSTGGGGGDSSNGVVILEIYPDGSNYHLRSASMTPLEAYTAIENGKCLTVLVKNTISKDDPTPNEYVSYPMSCAYDGESGKTIFFNYGDGSGGGTSEGVIASEEKGWQGPHDSEVPDAQE